MSLTVPVTSFSSSVTIYAILNGYHSQQFSYHSICPTISKKSIIKVGGLEKRVSASPVTPFEGGGLGGDDNDDDDDDDDDGELRESSVASFLHG